MHQKIVNMISSKRSNYLGCGVIKQVGPCIVIGFGGFSYPMLFGLLGMLFMSLIPWLSAHFMRVEWHAGIIFLCILVSSLFAIMSLLFTYIILFSKMIVLHSDCCDLKSCFLGYAFCSKRLSEVTPTDVNVYSRELSKTIVWWYGRTCLRNPDVIIIFDLCCENTEIQATRQANRYCSFVNNVFNNDFHINAINVDQ